MCDLFLVTRLRNDARKTTNPNRKLKSENNRQNILCCFSFIEFLVSVSVLFFLRMNFNWLTQKSRNYCKTCGFLSVPFFHIRDGPFVCIYMCADSCCIIILLYLCEYYWLPFFSIFRFSSDIFNGESLSKKKMLLDLFAGWVFDFHTAKKKQWEHLWNGAFVDLTLTWVYFWIGFPQPAWLLGRMPTFGDRNSKQALEREGAREMLAMFWSHWFYNHFISALS